MAALQKGVVGVLSHDHRVLHWVLDIHCQRLLNGVVISRGLKALEHLGIGDDLGP
jgi:CO dehydrogenase/acetyl-CoA synthase delta subunit